jgi:hypothetical protein
MILTALGVDMAGNKEVLARPCLCRGEQRWMGLRVSQDVRTRGATQIDLIVTDGHDGLLVAISELFSATPLQRWQVAQTTQCALRHPTARAWRRPGRTGRHLEPTIKAGGIRTTGLLQSQVCSALSGKRCEVWLRTKSTC